MQKIISLFRRDYDHPKRLVYNDIVPGAEWVIDHEGVATRKWNGTCCLIRAGRFFKRYDRRKPEKPAPPGWEPLELSPDVHTGHWPGWVPVMDGPEDQWHREAWGRMSSAELRDGTYELIGPKIQGNPDRSPHHALIRHGVHELDDVPRDFDGLRTYLERVTIEGIVWHHPDGRMVKIKKRDFWR